MMLKAPAQRADRHRHHARTTAACRSSKGRRERLVWPRGSGALAAERAIDRRRAASFRVRLVFRPRLVEGGKLAAGGVDRDDLRKALERHLQTPRIGDLRHQANIGERHVGAEGIGRRARPWPRARRNRR